MPARVQALSDVCFWLLTGVFGLVLATIAQYRQRRRADRELAKAHREWRQHTETIQESHESQMAAMQARLLEVQEARLSDIREEADRAEERATKNWQFNSELKKKESDAEGST